MCFTRLQSHCDVSLPWTAEIKYFQHHIAEFLLLTAVFNLAHLYHRRDEWYCPSNLQPQLVADNFYYPLRLVVTTPQQLLQMSFTDT